MSYDRFCRLYGSYAAVPGATSRVGHKAGRSIEVDWSGPTMQLLDPTTGEFSNAQATITLNTYSHLWPTAEDKTRTAADGLMAAVLDNPADSVRTEVN